MVQNSPNLLANGIRNVNSLLCKRDTTIRRLFNESIRMMDETEILNSFITICKGESNDKATKLDSNLQNKASQSSRKCNIQYDNPETNLLYGIPISVKDNFCTDQVLTTCGSKMLHDFVPNYTSTAVQKLLDANCLMMGKTNMDEFAMGSSSTTSYYGPTANYWKRELLCDKKPSLANEPKWFMAGGSSTGSATSVASASVFASLGTDTGGSARQPASLTGVVGFKPSYGLISRFGLIPLAHGLDVVSILARSVDDVKIVFGTVMGKDDKDMTSVEPSEVLSTKFKGAHHSNHKVTVRIGVPEEFIAKSDLDQEVSSQYDEIIKKLSNYQDDQVDFEIKKLKLNYAKYSTECYTIITSTEISSNMSCFDGVKYGYSLKPEPNGTGAFNRDEFYKANRDHGFGSEVKKRILLGNYFLMAEQREKYFVQALKLRKAISDEFDKAFENNQVDIILTPSTPNPSMSYEDWSLKGNYNKLFHEDYFLIPSNLANLPSISLPCGFSSSGLPLGIHLVGNKYTDLDLLYVSRLFEERVLEY